MKNNIAVAQVDRIGTKPGFATLNSKYMQIIFKIFQEYIDNIKPLVYNIFTIY